jgi:hypothetical protein
MNVTSPSTLVPLNYVYPNHLVFVIGATTSILIKGASNVHTTCELDADFITSARVLSMRSLETIK